MEIVADSMVDAWTKSIRYLLGFGTWVPTERNTRALEVRNLLLIITSPQLNPPLPVRYGFDRRFVAEHIGTFHTEQYTGASIRSRIYCFRGTINQVDVVVQRLRENWYSRRAVIITWEPVEDNTSDGPPCAVVLTFLIRDGKLCLSVVLRSNDAWLAVVPDMIALMQIQFEVARILSVPVGDYAHLAVSYHIYEPDVAHARRNMAPEFCDDVLERTQQSLSGL